MEQPSELPNLHFLHWCSLSSRRPKKATRRRKTEESESEESSESEDEEQQDEGEDQEMASEPDHVHSGPPNTDTEEEADPDREPRRRSARTAAKVHVQYSCVVSRSMLSCAMRFCGFQARIKQQARKAKHAKG